MITKGVLDVRLLALLGTKELVLSWWNSPNKAFKGKEPKLIPLDEVEKYLNSFL